ncbi:ASCH domain-containing protein [Methanocella sp. MCL-LM]|uniref:ASCH domain-containing protein n=1 Tax=Methanocella sp. MCL-LM TaxID=3412035 RepID=UPI003C7672F0
MKKITFWGRDENDDHLLEQVLTGKKTVTCSVASEYYADTEEEPAVPGDVLLVTDRRGKPRCRILVEKVYELPFGEAGEEIARGECCSSVEEFKAAHHRSWAEELQKKGLVLDDHTILVVEHFRLISPE